MDNTSPTATNIFWKVIAFIMMFFKSLVGIEDKLDKKNDNKSRSGPAGSSGGFFGGGGGGSGPANDNKRGGPRKFGPRGFKSITDLAPPPPPMGGCSGGACG